MTLFVLSRPFTGSIRDDGGQRLITSLNPVAGSLGIRNEVYLGVSHSAIAGFSKIFPVPRGTRTVSVGADFLISGELVAAALSLSYAHAELLVNIKAMGLNFARTPNGENHELRNTVVRQVSAVYQRTPDIGRFFNAFLRQEMPMFTPATTTRSYLLTATIESWAGCGGLVSWALANVFDGSTLEGFFINTDP